MAVCIRYRSILTKYLLHIEYLDEQIFWLVEEIKKEADTFTKLPSEMHFNSISEGSTLLN